MWQQVIISMKHANLVMLLMWVPVIEFSLQNLLIVVFRFIEVQKLVSWQME